MRKATFIPMTGLAALLGVQYANAAETIYDFSTGSLYSFAGNSATVSSATVPPGFTDSGLSALDIANKSTQTYGGGQTTDVPVDLINAPSFNITLTIATTPVAGTPPAAVYFDVVPVYFSTDGEIDPDTSNNSDFVNIGGTAPGTYTFTVDQNFYDPDGVLTSDSTPGEILAADTAYDIANPATPPTVDAINSFQLTVEHGGGTATTVYIDSITVPSAVTVPEPASLGLLAVGGLALKRRNRPV